MCIRDRSGIIKINIDKQLLQTEIGNTIVPNTLFWLALKAKNNTADYSLTSEIKLHGVSAVRLSKIEERPNSIDTPIIILPANTIQRTLSNEPNIKEIRQPFPSFQGRALEALIPYKKRIATELKHRNRPTQTEEVEAILLAQFPDLANSSIFDFDFTSMIIYFILSKAASSLYPKTGLSS